MYLCGRITNLILDYMKENEIYELLEITKNDASKMLMIFEENVKEGIEEDRDSMIEEIRAMLSDVKPVSSCKDEDEFDVNSKIFLSKMKSMEIEDKPVFYVTAKYLYDKGMIRNKDKRHGLKWSDLYGFHNMCKDEQDMDSPREFAREMADRIENQAETRNRVEKNIYKKIQKETCDKYIKWIQKYSIEYFEDEDLSTNYEMVKNGILLFMDYFISQKMDETLDNVLDDVIGGMVGYLVCHGLFRSNRERGEKHIAYPDFKKWIEKRFFLSLTEEEYCNKMEMWIKDAEVGEDLKRKSSTILKTFHLRKSAPPLHYRGDFMKDLDAYFWGGVIMQAIEKDEYDYLNKAIIIFVSVILFYFIHYHLMRVFLDAKPEWIDEEEWNEGLDIFVERLKGFYDLPFYII